MPTVHRGRCVRDLQVPGVDLREDLAHGDVLVAGLLEEPTVGLGALVAMADRKPGTQREAVVGVREQAKQGERLKGLVGFDRVLTKVRGSWDADVLERGANAVADGAARDEHKALAGGDARLDSGLEERRQPRRLVLRGRPLNVMQLALGVALHRQKRPTGPAWVALDQRLCELNDAGWAASACGELDVV